jgi:TonB family protein
MRAAHLSGAGWQIVGAVWLAGCSAIPIPLTDMSIPMPGIPGFGQPTVTAAMEPVPLAGEPVVERAREPARGLLESDRPAFFVQWKPQMPGLTRRPRIDASTALPAYPEAAVKKEEAGVTTLESCVTVEGRMVDVKLARSSGSVALDSATLAWAQTAKFAPAEFNGQPMAVCGYRLDYEWRVQEQRSR